MIAKLLIANRGEIACRVIKSAKAMGIQTVAVYSRADENALHVKLADEAVLLGDAPSKDSYLRSDAIIEYAKTLNVDAIHPGYGFLSENAHFADACQQNGIIFVGPPSSAIKAMGSKSAAKHIMEDAGVPLVPGYHGDDQDEVTLKQAADNMGYPVLLKAAAGGGGKGMRQVWDESEFSSALSAAKREAMASFGDDHMLIEKYLTHPRHVEIQVFCDTHGNGVYLFERDCSVQRRHQKVIEEAPAPGLPNGVREQMGKAALKAAHAINYVGAGTVEFLLDEDGSFYFMEMNTRLQVEHPVTEMITREDLVQWQILVAEGNPLPKKQSELTLSGHAFEARIYAEDPNNEFLPATGTLSLLKPPQENNNVRVDTGVVEGDKVSVFYDPMIAKLIVWGEDRDKALKRLVNALGQYYIDGVTTNIDFLMRVAKHNSFAQAKLTTTFIEEHAEQLLSSNQADASEWVPAMALLALLSRHKISASDLPSPWHTSGAWRANMRHEEKLTLQINGEAIPVNITHLPNPSLDKHNQKWQIDTQDMQTVVSGTLSESGNNSGTLIAHINNTRKVFTYSHNGDCFGIFSHALHCHFSVVAPNMGDDNESESNANLNAPMNGTVVAHLVDVGTTVKQGTPLLIIEAMKMEHSIIAPYDGCVTGYFYQPGELVDDGAVLIDFTPVTEEK